MAQPPIRRLPEGIEEKPDAEVAQAIFGKASKKELDKLAEITPKSIPPE